MSIQSISKEITEINIKRRKLRNIQRLINSEIQDKDIEKFEITSVIRMIISQKPQVSELFDIYYCISQYTNEIEYDFWENFENIFNENNF